VAYDEFVPSWLTRALIDDQLPWDEARETTVAAFLLHYTLHDSSWIGLWVTPGLGAKAVIRWDAYWSGGRIPHPGPLVAYWPILVIRFRRMYLAESLPSRSDYHESGIRDARSEDLNVRDWPGGTARLPDEELVRTVIQGHVGTVLSLIHTKDVSLLCMSSQGTPLHVPYRDDASVE
jgi:hypothetical protein